MVLAKAGIGKTSAALDLIEKLHKEEENLVWGAIEIATSNVSKILWEQPDDVRRSYLDFINFLNEPLVKKLSYVYSDSDTPDTRELRTRAITNCAGAEEPSVVKELTSRFANFQKTGDESGIPPDLLRVTYATAVKFGGQKEYDAVKAIWKNPPTPSVKVAALDALTKTKDPNIVKQTLHLLPEVPLQDWYLVVFGLGQNRHSRRLLTQWFKDNYDDITQRIKSQPTLSLIVKYTFSGYSSEKDAEDIESFFKDKDVSKYNLALTQALDSIRANAVWLDRAKGDIVGWLDGFSKRYPSRL